jgi:hypothetical protein
MNDEELDDLIVHFSEHRSQRWIAQCPHVGRDRIGRLLSAHREGVRIAHHLGRPSKATPEINLGSLARTPGSALARSDQGVREWSRHPAHRERARFAARELGGEGRSIRNSVSSEWKSDGSEPRGGAARPSGRSSSLTQKRVDRAHADRKLGERCARR